MGAKIFRDADTNLTLRGHVGSSVQEYAGANVINFEDVTAGMKVTVNVPASISADIRVTPPSAGWEEGTNTFTVSAENACVVAVSYDGGSTYTRLKATAQPDGSYSFTADNVTDGVIFKIAYIGDVDGSGATTQADVTKLKNAILGNIELTAEEECMADVNGDGRFSNADVTRAKAIYLEKVQPRW